MIPGMPSVGGLEVLILLAIVLLFFGAKRIPDLARSLGKGAREFRKGISEGAEEDDKAQDRSEGDRKEARPVDGAATRSEAPRTAEQEAETTSTKAEQKA